MATEPKTAVNIKLKYDITMTSSMYWKRIRFLTLAYDCKAFADKTLLIKELVEDSNKMIFFLCPRLWGRSMNLDMIKVFFQLQVNDTGHPLPITSTRTYRLFAYGEIITYQNPTIEYLPTPLLISQYPQIIEQHQGKYPVICLNLGSIGQDMDHQAAVEMYKFCASKAFRQHKYIVSIILDIIQDPKFDVKTKTEAQKRLFKFKDILYYRYKLHSMRWNNRPFFVEDVINSIYLLSETLHIYLQKKVILLIDNYDRPWSHLPHNRRMSKEDRQKTFDFYATFMTKTLKDNSHLERVIMTGTIPPLWEHKQTIFQQAVEYSYLNGHFMEYYGYNQWELPSWYSFFNISKKMQNDFDVWYDGYKANNKDLKIYNPRSTTQFWWGKKFESYWTDTWNADDMLRKVVRVVPLRKKLYSLINGNDILVNFPRDHFTWKEFLSIDPIRTLYYTDSDYQEIMSFDKPDYGDQFVENFLMWLQIHGYLTLSENTHLAGQYRLKIPNVEVWKALKRGVELHHEFILELDMEPELGVAMRRKLIRFINNNLTYCVSFENLFLKYMRMSPNFFKYLQNGSDQNEDILNLMFNYLLLGAGRIQKRIQPPDGTGRPTALLEFEKRIVILKFTFDETSAQRIVQQMKSCQHTMREIKPHSKIIKYIGLNILKNKTIEGYAYCELAARPLLKRIPIKKVPTPFRRTSLVYNVSTTTTLRLDFWKMVDKITCTYRSRKYLIPIYGTGDTPEWV